MAGKIDSPVKAIFEENFSKKEIAVLRMIGVTGDDLDIQATPRGTVKRAAATEVAQGHAALLGNVGVQKGLETVNVKLIKFASGDIIADSNIKVLKAGRTGKSREDWFVNYVPNFTEKSLREVWYKFRQHLPEMLQAKGIL